MIYTCISFHPVPCVSLSHFPFCASFPVFFFFFLVGLLCRTIFGFVFLPVPSLVRLPRSVLFACNVTIMLCALFSGVMNDGCLGAGGSGGGTWVARDPVLLPFVGSLGRSPFFLCFKTLTCKHAVTRQLH